MGQNITEIITAPSGQYELRDIAVDQIATPVQVRDIDRAHVQRLADAIEAGDVLPPIEVFKNEHPGPEWTFRSYILGPGRHRLEAHKQLGRETIAAFIRPAAPIEQIERAQLLENLNRNDMLPIEEAVNVARLMANTRETAYLEKHPDAMSDPVGHVAALLGRSKDWVRDRMYIDRLCKPVRTLARLAQIPAGHLREIAKLGDQQQQWELAVGAVGLRGCRVEVNQKGDITWAKPGAAWGTSEAEFLQHVAEGSVRRMTVEQVRHEVEALQRPLKGVPWDLSLPVVQNGTKLPACAGCEHNSATDHALFAVEGEQQHGVCHNGACYETKKAAAEQAKKDLLKLATRKKQPTAEQIDEKRPEWFKANTARGFVQREFKKRNPAEGDAKPASSSANGTARAPLQATHKLTPKQEHTDALNKWHTAAIDTFCKWAESDPYRIALLLILLDSKHAGWNGEKSKLRPWLERLAVEGDEQRGKVLLEAAAWLIKNANTWSMATDDPSCYLPDEPDACGELVEAIGVELPPKPTLEEFLPKPEPEPKAESQEPTAKSKKKRSVTAKKKTKKKSGGKGGKAVKS